MRVAVTIASPAEATEPRITAIEPFARFAGLVLRLAARARADLQHFGRRDAFGVRQIGVSSRARGGAES